MTTRILRRRPVRSWRDPLVWGVVASAGVLVLNAVLVWQRFRTGSGADEEPAPER